MKRINLKKIIRKTSCILLALATFVIYSAFEPLSAYAASSEQAYKWRRVETIDELQSAIAAVHNKKFSDMDRDWSKDTYWTRCLLIWKSGDNYYFASKGAGSSSNDWYGIQVASNYGIKPGEVSFLTRTGLDTPWLKDCVNGQHWSQSNQYCLRLCTEGTETMSSYFAAVEFDCYGVKYHAITDDDFNFKVTSSDWSKLSWKHSGAVSRDVARSFNFVFCPGWTYYINKYSITEKEKNSLLAAYNYTVREARVACSNGGCYTYYVDVHPSTPVKIDWVWNHCTDTEVYDNGIFVRKITAEGFKEVNGEVSYNNLFKPMLTNYANRNKQAEDGTAYFYYNFNGNIRQRFWCKSGSRLYIDDKSAFDTYQEDCVSFYVYIGTPTAIATYDTSQTLPPGIIFFGNMEKISAGVILRVNAGTTMVIDGQLLNSGRIIVDGGTVVVKDVLYCDGEKVYDGLSLMRGGVCIIESTGCYLCKGKEETQASYIDVTSGSLLYVEGVVVAPNVRVHSNSTIRATRDSAMCIGAVILDNVEVKKYTVELLKQYKSSKLSSLVKGLDFRESNGLEVYDNASFVSLGGVYAMDIHYSNTYYIDFWRETDLGRTIQQTMRW